MADYWRSLRPYWQAVRKAWLALFFTVVLGAIGGYGLVFHVDVKLPAWAWFILAFVCLSIAQFLAFHQMRVERDAVTKRTPKQIGVSMEGPGVYGNVFEDLKITFHNPTGEESAGEESEPKA